MKAGRSAERPSPRGARDSAVVFGPRGELAGVVTEPDAPSRDVTCVLVSAGLMPKFGPYRLYTELARRLARDGFWAMRFDLGGIGDSRQTNTGRPLRERTAAEIRAAVDLVEARFGSGRVVLGGLCSGAEDAFRYAESDPRVRGVVLLDPFAYRTAGWRWRHIAHRATRRAMRALGVYEPIAARATIAQATASESSLVKYKYMDHDESSRILRALIARGARSHFVYTGGMNHSFNHDRQLGEMFAGIDFGGLVTLDHFPRMDHTQVLEEDRRVLVEAIRARLDAAFPPVAR